MKMYLYKFKRTIFLVLLSSMIGSSVFATKTPIATLDLTSLNTAITNAESGDTILLPDGTLKLAASGDAFTITGKVLTFKAAPGAKPILGAIFKLAASSGIVLDSIEFDQTFTGSNRQYAVQITGTPVSKIKFKNCYVHHTSRSAVISAAAYVIDSLVVENSIFYACGGGSDTYPVFGTSSTSSTIAGFKAVNSTFYKVNGPLLRLAYNKTTVVSQSVLIDHCTIDSLYSATSPFYIASTVGTNSFTVSNSIISNLKSITGMFTRITFGQTACNVYNTRYFSVPSTATDSAVSALVTLAATYSNESPNYSDFANHNYIVNNVNFLTASSTGGLIGDPRWSPSNDAYISNLAVNGILVPGFKSNIQLHAVILPYGTTTAPVVTYLTQNAGSTVVKTPYGTNELDSTVLVVTAKDGATQQKYKIVYSIAPPATDATLKTLSFNGTSIFQAGVYKYVVVLAKGTTLVPDNSLFAYAVNNQFAIAGITQASGLSDSTSIIVTAQNGDKLTYKIGFTVLPWTVTVAANPAIGGTASIANNKTSYQPNETATLSAVANTKYYFVAWKNHSSGTVYSYKADTVLTVTQDSSLVAEFEKVTTLTTLDSLSLATAITNAATGDTILLPTGTLKLKIAGNSFTVSGKVLTFKAKPGTKPVIGAIFKLGASSGATFDGVELDQTFTGSNRTYAIQLTGTPISKIKFKNCNIHHTSRSAVYTNAAYVVDSIVIDNSVFYACGGGETYPLFGITSTSATVSDFKAINSTFYKINGPLLRLAYNKATPISQTVLVDHCTIDSLYNATSPFNIASISGTNSFTVSNSILSNFKAITGVFTRITFGQAVSNVSNSRCFNMPATATDSVVSSLVTLAATYSSESPNYNDIVLHNYTLNNPSFLSASSTGGIIGDPRWSPANDANLASIAVNGVNIPEFKSNVSQFDLSFPYGTSTAPVVTYYTQNAGATVVKNPYGTNGLDSTILVVTAKDGLTQKKYKIVYTITPISTDATLKVLSFNGISILQAGIYKYGVALAKGTTMVPDNSLFVYTLNNQYASAVITQASGLSDSTSIVVTAQNGDKLTYKIGFSVLPWNVTVSASPVAGGSATLAGGKTDYQQNETATLSAVANTNYVFVAWKNKISGTIYSHKADTVLTVTSDSALVAIFESSDATLKSINFKGNSIPLIQDWYLYGVKLAQGTTLVPDNANFIFETSSMSATAVITKAASLSDSTTIEVTAQNGNKLTYKIGFIVLPWKVSVVASPVEGGSATLAGNKTEYQSNEIATLSAVANTNYEFVAWKNNSSGTIYSVHADTVLTVTQDSSLVAVFKTKPNQVSSVTGTEVKVFPNPASDFINIISENKAEVRVYNALGKMVIYDNIDANGVVIINKLKPGIYVAKIKSGTKVTTVQIVKQ